MSRIMKSIIIFFLTFIFFNEVNAQFGIGTNTPNSSAALDISDSTKGLLIPRMTMNGRLAIVNPAKGLFVYQTNDVRGMWYYDGSVWRNFYNAGFFTDTSSLYQLRSSTGIIAVVYTNSNAYAYSTAWFGGPWYPEAINGTVLGGIALDNVVVIYTATTAYSFSFDGWSAKPTTGTPMGIGGVANMVVLATSTNLYGCTQAADTGTGGFIWFTQPISGTPLGSLAGMGYTMYGINSFVAVYTDSFAYALAANVVDGIPPYWSSQALSGTVQGSTVTSGLAVVYTTTNAYGFAAGAGAWAPFQLPAALIGVAP